MNEQLNDTGRTDVPDNKVISTADMASARKDTPMTTDALMRSTGGSGNTRVNATPLFNNDETQSFRSRWNSIQTGFVDEPRHAVENADQLVAELMQKLAQSFASEKDKLEDQWARGQDASTEDLRVSLQRYRSFFDRLLSL